MGGNNCVGFAAAISGVCGGCEYCSLVARFQNPELAVQLELWAMEVFEAGSDGF